MLSASGKKHYFSKTLFALGLLWWNEIKIQIDEQDSNCSLYIMGAPTGLQATKTWTSFIRATSIYTHREFAHLQSDKCSAIIHTLMHMRTI